MRSDSGTDMYTPREIAVAAGVPVADVLAALNGVDGYVPHADAVRLGRLLAGWRTSSPAPRGIAAPSFAAAGSRRSVRALPFVTSTALHLAFAAVAFLLLTQ